MYASLHACAKHKNMHEHPTAAAAVIALMAPTAAAAAAAAVTMHWQYKLCHAVPTLAKTCHRKLLIYHMHAQSWLQPKQCSTLCDRDTVIDSLRSQVTRQSKRLKSAKGLALMRALNGHTLVLNSVHTPLSRSP
jgi:hypothetical protein